MEELIRARMEHEGRDYDYCAREVLADALAKILPDSNFAQALVQKNMTWVEQLVDMLKQFIADIKAALRGSKLSDTAPHVDIRENINGTLQYLEEIRQMYDKLAAGAVENFQAAMEATAETEAQMQKNTTREGSVSHSIKRTRRMTLQEQLSAYYDKSFYQSDSFYFGETPSNLSRSGLESHPLAMMQDDFKKSTRTKHNIPRRVLKKLHSAISHPVFSFTAGKQVAIMTTEIDGDGKPVVVAIHGGHNMDRMPVNVIKSIYGVDSVAEWVGQQIDGGSKFRIYDIEKTTAMLQTQGYLAAVGAESDGSWDTITQTGVGVKEENAAQGKEAKVSGKKKRSAADAASQHTDSDYLKSANLTERELADGERIVEFIEQVNNMIDTARRSKRKKKIGPVSQNHANIINSIVRTINPGFSAEGYELWIDGTGASHIERRHGQKGKADHSMATREAKMLIPWVSQNATAGDFIYDDNGNIKLSDRFYNNDQSRAPEIRLEREINGDTVYVSECVPDSVNKIIWITSAYIKKGSTGQLLNMEEESSPQPTPEATFDGNATKDIVSQPETVVKDETETKVSGKKRTVKTFKNSQNAKGEFVANVLIDLNDPASEWWTGRYNRGILSMSMSDDTEFRQFYAEIEKRTKDMEEYDEAKQRGVSDSFSVRDGKGKEYIYVVELDGYLHGVVLEKIDFVKYQKAMQRYERGKGNGRYYADIGRRVGGARVELEGYASRNGGSVTSDGTVGSGRVGGKASQRNLAKITKRESSSDQEVSDSVTETKVSGKKRGTTLSDREVLEVAAQGKEAKVSHHARPSIKDPEKLDPRTVTEADVLKMLNDVRDGRYYDNTYIPVRINTPSALIYWAKERLGDVIDNNPIAISAGKAYQAMARSGEDIDGTPHELSPEDIVEIIRTMNKPRYIIFQGENERYAEVIQYETSTKKKAVAVLDIGFHKAEWTMNGFEAGLYNILVTTFPPDAGVVDSMLSKKGNVVIFDSEKDASRSAPGSNVPSDSSDTPFYEDSINQEKEAVKSEEKDMASISYKKRGTTLSDREVLEVAALRMDTSTLTEGEQTALDIFKKRLEELRGLQIERERLGSLWHEQQFGSGDRAEAPRTLARMKVLDGQIERAVNSVLSVEDKQVLRDVLQKAREYVKEHSVEHYRGILARRKDRSTQAQLRQKLHSTVHELSQLLLHGDKQHHVPEGLKKAVAGALDAINSLDAKKTAAQIAALDSRIMELLQQKQAITGAMTEVTGIVCIFITDEDNCFAPSSRRGQRSSALHLDYSIPADIIQRSHR